MKHIHTHIYQYEGGREGREDDETHTYTKNNTIT